jgi:hypothetical protein
MQPIATYSTRSIEVKMAFTLFPDSVVVRYSRGVLGPKGEERFPLTTLDPTSARIRFRRDVYITAGGIIGGASLLLLLRLFRQQGIGWLLLGLTGIAICGVTLVCTGLRRVEYAQFQTQAGAPVLRVPRFARDSAAFESFIEALTKQIRAAKETA